MLFTADLNRLAWRIKKSQNISWGASLRLAIKVASLPSGSDAHPSSVFGEWSASSHYAVAGHFWGLHKAYSEIGDTGRSIAMSKVAKTLYAMYEEMVPVQFNKLIRQRGIKESIASEIVDFYAAAYHGVPTARSLELMSKGASHYQSVIKLPRWTF